MRAFARLHVMEGSGPPTLTAVTAVCGRREPRGLLGELSGGGRRSPPARPRGGAIECGRDGGIGALGAERELRGVLLGIVRELGEPSVDCLTPSIADEPVGGSEEQGVDEAQLAAPVGFEDPGSDRLAHMRLESLTQRRTRTRRDRERGQPGLHRCGNGRESPREQSSQRCRDRQGIARREPRVRGQRTRQFECVQRIASHELD